MDKAIQKLNKRIVRHSRIRARVEGTSDRPRLAVFRSNRFLYAQLINDDAGKTLAAADSRTAKGKTAVERAKEVGVEIAKQAKTAGIDKVVFDRGGFKYQGAIAELASAARDNGLVF